MCPLGVAVLGKPSRSQSDSEILEPGKHGTVHHYTLCGWSVGSALLSLQLLTL